MAILMFYILSASSDVRQAYRQFLGALAEINSEMILEEFRQVAKAVYDLFSSLDTGYDNIRVISSEKRYSIFPLLSCMRVLNNYCNLVCW